VCVCVCVCVCLGYRWRRYTGCLVVCVVLAAFCFDVESVGGGKEVYWGEFILAIGRAFFGRINMSVHAYVCIYVYKYIRVLTYVYIHMHICICTCFCIYKFGAGGWGLFGWVHTGDWYANWAFFWMNRYVCTCIRVYTYT